MAKTINLLIKFVLSAVLLVIMNLASAGASNGKQVFEERCSRCHDLPDPGSPPETGWENRLKLMAKLAKLTPEQKSEVFDYLQSHTQKATRTVSLADERKLFKQKCSLCHTLERIYLMPLNEESRRHIVKRMKGKLPGWISEEESRLILDYLGKTPRVEHNKKAKGEAGAIFKERCGACHTLERVYAKMVDEKSRSWLHIVKRMQEKAPQWLSRGEAELVIEYLQSVKQKRETRQ